MFGRVEIKGPSIIQTNAYTFTLKDCMIHGFDYRTIAIFAKDDLNKPKRFLEIFQVGALFVFQGFKKSRG
jgi:hypothetical protein